MDTYSAADIQPLPDSFEIDGMFRACLALIRSRRDVDLRFIVILSGTSLLGNEIGTLRCHRALGATVIGNMKTRI